MVTFLCKNPSLSIDNHPVSKLGIVVAPKTLVGAYQAFHAQPLRISPMASSRVPATGRPWCSRGSMGGRAEGGRGLQNWGRSPDKRLAVVHRR